MRETKVKTVVVEENHEAFFVWNNEIWNQRLNAKENALFHFDEHIDMCPPRVSTSIHHVTNIEKLQKFTYDELSINTFIVPALYQGIFNRVYWLNHNNNNTKPVKRCVRTYNNEGKKFILFNPAKVPFKGNNNFQKYVVLPGNLNTVKIINHRNAVLDISLNYFSCVSDPTEYRVSYIEITKKEFDEFSTNHKYHNLKFELLGHRVSVKEENGKYFYVLNDHDEIYSSTNTLSKQDIIRKIDDFIWGLRQANLKPTLITITKSVKSGYTPEDLAEFIEIELINRLKKIYSLDLTHINEYTDCHMKSPIENI